MAPLPEAPAAGLDWRSERFAELATAQLGRLGEALGVVGRAGAGGEVPAEVREVAEPGARSTSVRPLAGELDAVFREGLWVVNRPAAELPDAADGGLAEALTAWLGGGPIRRLERLKFKLFDVDLADAARPVTWQYVAVAGPGENRYHEENATWRIGWSWDGAGAPRIAEVVLEAFEEVERRGTEEPLFRDSTAGVLGGSAAFREQLAFGNPHWRQRIEAYNRFFKFGHHGVAVGDADGDGRDDIYLCQPGGLPNRLFLQQPDGTAREVAAEHGLDLLDLTRGALFADLDNDGDQDLVLATDSGILAYENSGAGEFEPRVRYPLVTNTFSIAAADYDLDGDLDLYACRYFASRDEGGNLAIPVPYFAAENGGNNFLIRNDGPQPGAWLGFSDATAEAGLDAANSRFSFAAVWEDTDDDGDPDLFVANDFGLKSHYRNDGGRFTETAAEAGLLDGGFGMSAAASDYDGDGLPDLYAGNMFSAAGTRVTSQPGFRPGADAGTVGKFRHMARGNSLFRNRGGGRFDDVSVAAGVTVGRWSWGSVFADLNNDGREDLAVANGFVTGSVPDDL